MSVSICIRARRLSPAAIARTLINLVEIDIELYEAKIVTASPWSIVWVPDDEAETSTMSDVSILLDRGYGSCGELACAYAAWLAVFRHGGKTLQLVPNGSLDAWHVRATRGRCIYDPQVLGNPELRSLR